MNRLAQKNHIWLVLGNWKIIERGNYTIYNCDINSPKMIKVLDDAHKIETKLRRKEELEDE